MLQEKVLDEYLSGNNVGRVEGESCDHARNPRCLLLTSAMPESAMPESAIARFKNRFSGVILERSIALFDTLRSERGDVPGWVLVVLMTTGLVTGIWTLAAPRIDSILRNSLDSMGSIR